MKKLFFLPVIILISSFAQADTCVRLPATFDGNRIFLSIKASGRSLRFYTDSGGGLFPFIFDDISTKLMDTRIDGAIGGNVFRFFKIIADYPRARLFVKDVSKQNYAKKIVK